VRLLFWNRYSKEERIDLDVYEEHIRTKDPATGDGIKFLKIPNRVAPDTEPGNYNNTKVADANESSRTAELAASVDSAKGIVLQNVFSE